jgi:CheY-like chemotaxis protein
MQKPASPVLPIVDKAILLLDDNELQLMTRRTILRQAGHSVHAALKPAEALEFVRDAEQGPALKLIITDHWMPGMRGDEFIREVRKVLPEIAVLVITGHPEAAQDYEGLNVEFLAKPCAPEALLAHAAHAYDLPMTRTA